MSDLLIDFVELIYPDDFDKQDVLMDDIINMGNNTTRLKVFTSNAFRTYYELHGTVPFTPKSHLQDMFAIMGKN